MAKRLALGECDPISISLHQVAERRVDGILGLLEGRMLDLALGSRLSRLRRNAEGAGDAGENGHALVHRHFSTAVDDGVDGEPDG